MIRRCRNCGAVTLYEACAECWRVVSTKTRERILFLWRWLQDRKGDSVARRCLDGAWLDATREWAGREQPRW